MQKIVSWLKLAFVLCREVPVLFQKVSSLLAAICALSLEDLPFGALSKSQWAFYFQQASINCTFNHQLSSKMSGKRFKFVNDVEAASVWSPSLSDKSLDNLSVAPKSVDDLELFVKNFLGDVPCTTIICLSLLGNAFVCLKGIMPPSPVNAWMLLSRFSSTRQPVVVVLPMLRVSLEGDGDYKINIENKGKKTVLEFSCPYSSSLIDDVLPQFKQIMEMNHYTSYFLGENTAARRESRRTRRMNIDNRLKKLIGCIQDSWFGSAKHFLMEGDSHQPIFLVLDFELAMLPWESIPILREKEVYRMPSFASMHMMISRSSQEVEGISWPSIDVKHGFYLLNPDEKVYVLQAFLKKFFQVHNLKGIAGKMPTHEDMVSALQGHDLFIYGGHGYGRVCFSQFEIQKLEKCASVLLGGCSSGSVHLKGSYTPQGAPISYITVGSPCALGFLWQVEKIELVNFLKMLINMWFQETQPPSSRSVSGTSPHGQTIGSFFSKVRRECDRPYLLGAASICYGMPMCIKKRTG